MQVVAQSWISYLTYAYVGTTNDSSWPASCRVALFADCKLTHDCLCRGVTNSAAFHRLSFFAKWICHHMTFCYFLLQSQWMHKWKIILQTLHRSNAKDCGPTFHQHKNQKWTINACRLIQVCMKSSCSKNSAFWNATMPHRFTSLCDGSMWVFK